MQHLINDLLTTEITKEGGFQTRPYIFCFAFFALSVWLDFSYFVLFVSFVVKVAFPFLVAAPRFVNSRPFAATESFTSFPYSASLVRADLPVDVIRATPPHRRSLADSWADQKYSRANRASLDLTVQR